MNIEAATRPVPRSEPGENACLAAPRLSIIVVSYNTRDMTLDCLRSVHAETRVPFELIVVDNASTDGSAEAIAAEFPELTLIRETDNRGFAWANNRAAEEARGDYLLLLNPDTVVLDNALDRLLAFAEARPQARIWGGRTFYGDMRLNPYSCWRRISLWNIFCRTAGLSGLFRDSPLFNPEAYGGWDRSGVRAVDIVTGCLLLIRREDWDRLGGFDPDFVMYGEEADLCLRARAIGADPHVTPDASIIHYGGASETVRADKMVRIMRAKTELIKRHVPAWQRPLALALFKAWPLTRRWALGAAARLTASDDRAAARDTWAEIWSRRREWRDGFS